MVKFSAFADEVADDFREQVAFLVAQGIQNIEIRSLNNKNILDLNEAERAETKALLDANGIAISAIGSPIGKIRLDEPFEPHLDKLRYAVELADFFDAPFIRIFSYYAPEGKRIDQFRDQVLERMRMETEILKGSDIILVHENESHIYGHSAENCADIAKSVNSPNLKLVYDPANFVWGGRILNNMERCWPLVQSYVVHVHIKDWKLGSHDVGSIPGEGDGQIKELLKTLFETGYSGFITLEPHLEMGGQFGGRSGPILFEKAIRATRQLCDAVGLAYC